ncbi:hypothetical protein FQZ97_1238230 [compost metagenome]
MHDRQEIRRDIKQKSGDDQGQTPFDHVQTMRLQLVATAWACSLVSRLQVQPPHEQIALMAGNKLLQRQVLQGSTLEFRHELARSRLSQL